MDKSGDMFGQCWCPRNGNEAIIYQYGHNEPEDYMLHEILHVAVRSLLQQDRRRHKELIHQEELFVQDICAIFMEYKNSKLP